MVGYSEGDTPCASILSKDTGDVANLIMIGTPNNGLLPLADLGKIFATCCR
jgi:hypothetical protein